MGDGHAVSGSRRVQLGGLPTLIGWSHCSPRISTNITPGWCRRCEPRPVSGRGGRSSYAEVEAANQRLQQALIHSERPHPEVTGVGTGMADRKFVIRVSAENLTDEMADAVRATVAPDVVVVEPGQRARRG